MINFKTNDVIIRQVRAISAQREEVFYHGDGNIYTKEIDSNFRKEFGNPGQEESKYRIKFKKGDKIPGTVKEMNDLLLSSRNKELIQESKPVTQSVTDVFTIPEEDPEPLKASGKKPKAEKVEATEVE
jgi:hypothetical protein